MTGHWEFTYGEARVTELIKGLGFPFLALNMRDTEWNEPVFEPMKMFERGGVKIAVLGQAFPYTPVANPRWLMPKWSFGIREEDVRANVDKARKSGAQLVVLLSHNGFDVDRKLAARVAGIDVILTGHTHDALPEAIKVGKTLLIASGSHGKFVSRLDLDVQNGVVKGFRYKLIPLFADAIKPDAEMTAAIAKARAPYANELARVVGQGGIAALPARQFQRHLRRRDLRGANERARRRDRAVARLPLGHQRAAGRSRSRWRTSTTPPRSPIRRSIASAMTGERLKEMLEDVADNLFNPDPYYQQGGDMVRCGGLGYAIDVAKPIGQRISAHDAC